jgi:beta-N-acetylhexosaminidase
MSPSDLERLAAGLFMVGFEANDVPTAHALRLIDIGCFGAILFKRNVSSPTQVAGLIEALKRRAARPFALAVDQEGGRVARLRGAPFVPLPPMRSLGLQGDLASVMQVGRLLAYEVRSLGFDWDFAPVLDVDTNPANPVIGDRSFHREAAEVARLGVALAQGIEAGGVASCGKHFPGHGDTSQDSHLSLPRLPHPLDRLERVELLPFRAYAQAGLASVMTAHVVFEALDATRPATMSRPALGQLLRERLGFQGVIVSDDLEMKAIAAHHSVRDAVLQGLEAGVDLFLVCHTEEVQQAAIEAVVDGVRHGVVTVERLQASQRRLSLLAQRFVHGPQRLEARLGSAEHLALAQGLAVQAASGVDPTEVLLA